MYLTIAVVTCRTWHVAMTSPASSATLASWTLLLLDWVANFIQQCPALKRNSATVETAAAAFDKHIRHVLSETRSLSQILKHLSGAECAAQLQNCQDCPAGRGRHICISQQSTAVLLPLMSLTRTLGTITVNVMAEDVMQVCPLQSSRNESAPVYLLVAEARC